MKPKIILAIISIPSLLVLIAIAWYYFDTREISAPDNKIVGIVGNVTRGNELENTTYYFDVLDDRGKKHVVNASIPMTIQSSGQDCATVPLVTKGDKLEFNLPVSRSNNSDFDVCWKSNVVGYYFTITNRDWRTDPVPDTNKHQPSSMQELMHPANTP